MILDLDRLREATLRRDPFDFVVVEDFVRPEYLPGLLPVFRASGVTAVFRSTRCACDAEFAGFAAELEGEALRREIERKFAIDLSGRPTMITVRGQSDGKDGRIHTDSATKLITLLLYLNPVWDERAAGCACCAGPTISTTAPPRSRRSPARWWRSGALDASFHGHYPHRGERRVVQLNWVTEPAVVRREIARHRWSARLKAFNLFK